MLRKKHLVSCYPEPLAFQAPHLFFMEIIEKIRNIAIIAHVDHGKTTLVDQLLRQSGTFRSNQAVVERVMDSMDLEREKGHHHQGQERGVPVQGLSRQHRRHSGHADFGGEVERISR